MPLHLLDIRQWQHHRQVHRKVDQPAHFVRPTGVTSKLKIRAHSYELLIILYYQEIIIIKYECFVNIFLLTFNLYTYIYIYINSYINIYNYIYIYIYTHNYIYI